MDAVAADKLQRELKKTRKVLREWQKIQSEQQQQNRNQNGTSQQENQQNQNQSSQNQNENTSSNQTENQEQNQNQTQVQNGGVLETPASQTPEVPPVTVENQSENPPKQEPDPPKSRRSPWTNQKRK